MLITACADTDNTDELHSESVPVTLFAAMTDTNDDDPSIGTNTGDNSTSSGGSNTDGSNTDGSSTDTNSSDGTSTNASTTSAAGAVVPVAQTHFCFWQVELLNSAGGSKMFAHYSDVDPEPTLDLLYHQPYSTLCYYPTNYGYIYGYAFAEEVSAGLKATVNCIDETAYFDENKVLQTVTFTKETSTTNNAGTTPAQASADDASTSNNATSTPAQASANDEATATNQSTAPELSAWGQIYVSRNYTDGNYTGGYVRANLNDRYSNEDSKRFYFTHCVTRFKLKMKRSENMTGDNTTATVHNIRIYAPKRCFPTHLAWTVQDGFYAASSYADDADGNDFDTDNPVFSYPGFLLQGEYREEESIIYLLLDHYSPYADTDYPQLPLLIKATYGSDEYATEKTFDYNLSLKTNASKKGLNYRANESYTVHLIFDSDALHLKADLDTWETGNVTFLIWNADATTGGS
jgi:hypothetical protein